MAGKLYSVVVTEKVRKIILKLPPSIASKIENSLLKLEKNQRPPGCKKLKGRLGYRIRIGDY
jgi:mRNA interferase RelE/StbE